MTARTLFAAALLPLAACGDADPEDPAAVVDPTLPEDASVDHLSPNAPPIYAGTLEVGDDTLTSGEYMDAYDVVAREGQWIRAEVVSTDFDPYFLILSPTDQQTDVDDSSDGNTSMTKAILRAEESGSWTVVVTSYAPGESGDYELTYEVLDERPDDAHEGQQVGPIDDTDAIEV